ncbi:MAG: polyphosphate kinase 2 family protein [Polyangia bacterium]|jgi:PPK2 family polyphosphate:nucleotide phosphotransferase
MSALPKKARQLAAAFRVSDGSRLRLADCDPADTMGTRLADKEDAAEAIQQGVAEISRLQETLYAQDRWALLLIFQAMDAAGKDGTIKHVLSGVNPQGCDVHSFKAPSSEELHHDFLWRCGRCLPERGRLGIFNRSYYEETLVVRVHPELLARENLPARLVTKHLWKERYQDIRHFERHLVRNGTVVLKFFLHLSRKEQKRRFLERLQNPAKYWKFSAADASERMRWNDYMAAYQDTIRHTATEEAPWYVVPADNKWFARLVVSSVVIDALSSLDLKLPEVDRGKLADLASARRALARKAG